MLRTDKIFLRAINSTDINFILSIENDTENWLVSNTQNSYTKKDIEQYISSIESLEKDKQFRWIICSSKTEKPIGAIDLFEFDAENRRAGIGIIIIKKHRNKGLATESITSLCNYAFKSLNLNQIWANVLENNTQSIHLFEKCHFIKTGVKKNWVIHNSHWLDMNFYQLMNKENIV